jgi:hypothetical protein
VLEDTLAFSYEEQEPGSVPTAMRDRWTEGELIFGNSRWRKLDVTVSVSMRRNNTLKHLALRNAPPFGNLQLAELVSCLENALTCFFKVLKTGLSQHIAYI